MHPSERGGGQGWERGLMSVPVSVLNLSDALYPESSCQRRVKVITKCF